MSVKFQFRRDTSEKWQTVDPILADGEVGLDTTVRAFKIGNGISAWSALPWAVQGALIDDAIANLYGTWSSEKISQEMAGKAEASHTHTAAEIGAQPADPDLTAIAALTGTTGLLKKTAANTWELDTSGGGGASEDTTTSFTYTYTGVMGLPPTPLPGSGSLFASPTGKERAFNVLFIGAANPGLTSIEFTKLEFVGGSFNPSGMPALSTLSMPALTAVGGNFQVSSMPALTTLNVPTLTITSGSFSLYNLAAFTTLSAPALTTIGSSFSLSSMSALTTLSMPALTTVGSLSLYNLAAFTTLSLPALKTMVYNFSLSNLFALTSLSLPALKTMGGTLSLSSMPTLTSLSLPAIERIGAAVDSPNATVINITSGTGALTSFSLPSTIKQVGQTTASVNITSAALSQASVDNILVRLAALDGTSGTVAFSNRKVTITGTSAAPSSTGLAAKATLVARGCTVTHN